MPEIKKTQPASGYPPEEGCYLRGNDFSPVAVCVILRWNREKTPKDIDEIIRKSIENGAALAGTLQTENIGLEKMICNLVANPNIRYVVVCGPESPGHLVGDAILALKNDGVNDEKVIIGAKGPTPYLFNLPREFIARFREQIQVIDLINEGSPDVILEAVRACYQENPTPFRNMKLFDMGAFPGPALSGQITWRVKNPEREPKNAEERIQKQKIDSIMERIRKRLEAKEAKRREKVQEGGNEGDN